MIIMIGLDPVGSFIVTNLYFFSKQMQEKAKERDEEDGVAEVVITE